MKLIRYEYDSGCENEHTGLLAGLDDIYRFPYEDIAMGLGWIFETELIAPTIKEIDTMSFFTPKGNRKFHKAIKKIEDKVAEKGIKLIRIEVDKRDVEVLYEDKYQVITPRPYDKKIPFKLTSEIDSHGKECFLLEGSTTIP